MSYTPALAPERDSPPAWPSPELLPFESRFVEVAGRDYISVTADARAALREAAFAAAEAAARARSLAALLDEALAVLADVETTPVISPTPSRASQPEADALSPREREVLALVAEGRTNKAIAAALFVSPNTVKTHVASLLHKLRADTRVQLAAIATMQGLHGRTAIGAR